MSTYGQGSIAAGVVLTGAINGGVTLNGEIDVKSQGDAAGFGVFDPDSGTNASIGSNGSVTLGNITVVSTTNDTSDARGVRLDGNVVGTLNTSAGVIFVESGGSAMGVHILGGIAAAGNSKFGEIIVDSSKATPNLHSSPTAVGIWTTDNSTFTLTKNITVTGEEGTGSGTHTHAFGIVVQNSDANITVDGNVIVSATGAATNTDIAVGGTLALNILHGASLKVGTIDADKFEVKFGGFTAQLVLTGNNGQGYIIDKISTSSTHINYYNIVSHDSLTIKGSGARVNVTGTGNHLYLEYSSFSSGFHVEDGDLHLGYNGTGGTLYSADDSLIANTVFIHEGATLFPFNDMAVTGNLTMYDGSELQVVFFDEHNYGRIDVSEIAQIGAIAINLEGMTPSAGTYSLITATKGLVYTEDSAEIWLGGALLTAGNRMGDAITVSGTWSALELTVVDIPRLNLTWTGTGSTNNVWDFETSNWVDTGSSNGTTTFASGDTVTFEGNTGATISIVGTKTVADMTITGGGNWTFNSGGINAETVDGSGGKLTMGGTGTLTLNNNGNNFAGGVEIASGTVVGNIGNNAQLTFTGSTGTYQTGNSVARSLASLDGGNTGTVVSVGTGSNLSIASGEFGGRITGAGQITKTGTGTTLILTGVNTFIGKTTVQGGTLLVNGSLYDSVAFNIVDVLSGGTLGGTGDINGTIIVRNGGRLAPGTSIGTLKVNHADVVFEKGGVYMVEVDKDSGTNDLLVVKGSNSTVEIQKGAVLSVEFINGTGVVGDRFHIIEADVITGDFTILGSWKSEIIGGDYYIVWKTFGDSLGAFATPNARRVADVVEKVSEFAPFSTAIGTLLQSNPERAAQIFGQLHGEVFATSKGAVVEQQRRFQQLLPTGREYFVAPEGESHVHRGQVAAPTRTWNRWGGFTGAWQRREGIGQYSGYDWMSTGFAAGIDRTITQRFLVGGAFAYDHSYMDFKSISARADIGAFRTMLYGTWYNGELFVDAYGGYTKNIHRTKREIDLRALSGNMGTFAARSSYQDDMGSVGLEVGRSWNLNGYVLTPSAGLHYTRLITPAIEEKWNADISNQTLNQLNLHIHKNDHESFRLPIGVKASRVFATSFGAVVVPEIRAIGTVEFADDSARVQTSFATAPHMPFYSDTGKWGRYSGRFGVGLGASVANRFNVRLDFDHEIFEHTHTNAFSGSVGVQW